MNRQPTGKAFGTAVFFLLVIVLLFVLGLQAIASASANHTPSSNYLNRFYNYSYITSQTQSGYSTSNGQGVLVSTKDSLLVFAITSVDGTTSYKAIPSHRLISMHTTDK